MSGTIKVLPPDVVELIAAGEVVERPASCIKELVENSLDAGATAVTVAIEGGGLDLIRVTDNGSGISPEDMRLVFLPHATSKLGRAEELHTVATLGFRGEAIPSIARVSKMTLTSRKKGSAAGMKAVNEGGQMVSLGESAAAEGTQVTVRDLFYNAPVRRDFMKKPQREAALCAELLQQLILSRPDVAFRLTSDGKQLYASPGDGKLDSAMLSVYGVDTLKALVKVDGAGAGMLVRGLVGIGEQARGNRNHQHFFLNGRAVRSGLLSRAVEEGCRHRVMIGRFPLCAIAITLPYEAVDVNVHPNKWEVRFLREQQVKDALADIITQAVSEAPLESPPPLFDKEPARAQATVTRVEPEQTQAEPAQLSPAPQPAETAKAPRAFVARDVTREEARPQEISPAPVTPFIEEKAEQIHAPQVQMMQRRLQVLGVAFHTYIIAQQGERLLLIDQHALHERLLFDRMMASADTRQPSQTLLLPQVIELDYPDYQAFLAYRKDLVEAGFEAEDFGHRAVRLVSVPVELGEPLAARSFTDALDELRGGNKLDSRSKRERIIMASCKHAVKGGERLPDHALQALADMMMDENTIPSCPHGRPIVLELTKRELERRFKRIQD
ncbi:MAG TPA: DNA mismatch repair endonuclease MutL [Clostridiales bacterium]|nr:DNA mismatch repair endonuclease MutL [Clostridiales bacterium]